MWLKATAGQTRKPTAAAYRTVRPTDQEGRNQWSLVSTWRRNPGSTSRLSSSRGELTEILGIKGIEALRIINRYDVEGHRRGAFRSCVPTVFSEPRVDVTYDELPASDGAVFAVEFLPGQFDQRADSASECVQLISRVSAPPCAPPRSI